MYSLTQLSSHVMGMGFSRNPVCLSLYVAGTCTVLSGEDIFKGSKWRSSMMKFESLMAKFWWWSLRVQWQSLMMKFESLMVKFWQWSLRVQWQSSMTKFESSMTKFWWQSLRVQQWSSTKKFRGFLALLAKFDSQSTLFLKFNSLLVPVVNIGEVYTPFLKSKSHLQSSSVIGEVLQSSYVVHQSFKVHWSPSAFPCIFKVQCSAHLTI